VAASLVPFPAYRCVVVRLPPRLLLALPPRLVRFFWGSLFPGALLLSPLFPPRLVSGRASSLPPFFFSPLCSLAPCLLFARPHCSFLPLRLPPLVVVLPSRRPLVVFAPSLVSGSRRPLLPYALALFLPPLVCLPFARGLRGVSSPSLSAPFATACPVPFPDFRVPCDAGLRPLGPPSSSRPHSLSCLPAGALPVPPASRWCCVPFSPPPALSRPVPCLSCLLRRHCASPFAFFRLLSSAPRLHLVASPGFVLSCVGYLSPSLALSALRPVSSVPLFPPPFFRVCPPSRPLVVLLGPQCSLLRFPLLPGSSFFPPLLLSCCPPLVCSPFRPSLPRGPFLSPWSPFPTPRPSLLLCLRVSFRAPFSSGCFFSPLPRPPCSLPPFPALLQGPPAFSSALAAFLGMLPSSLLFLRVSSLRRPLRRLSFAFPSLLGLRFLSPPPVFLRLLPLWLSWARTSSTSSLWRLLLLYVLLSVPPASPRCQVPHTSRFRSRCLPSSLSLRSPLAPSPVFPPFPPAWRLRVLGFHSLRRPLLLHPRSAPAFLRPLCRRASSGASCGAPPPCLLGAPLLPVLPFLFPPRGFCSVVFLLASPVLPPLPLTPPLPALCLPSRLVPAFRLRPPLLFFSALRRDAASWRARSAFPFAFVGHATAAAASFCALRSLPRALARGLVALLTSCSLSAPSLGFVSSFWRRAVAFVALFSASRLSPPSVLPL